MDGSSDLPEDTLSDEGDSSPSSAIVDIDGVDEPEGVGDQALGPAEAGISGERHTWLLWLIAGAVIVGGAIFGLVLFVILNSGQGAEAVPTSTRAIGFITSTPRPTATRTPTATASATPSPTSTPTPVPTPTPDVILLGVKALGELNTVEYSLKTVVDKEAHQPGAVKIGSIEIWRPRIHFLLVAGGSVKAGVDFSEMVRYEIVDNKVTVVLVAPRITSYAVDIQDLKLYYIHTGFGLDEEFVIETYNEAIAEAQENLRHAALESDILDAAKTNAVALVQSLILGLGFSDVTVEFVPPQRDEPLELEQPWETIPTLAPFLTATKEG